MMFDRATIVDEQFINNVRQGLFPKAKSTTHFKDAVIDKATAIDLFDSQIKSRHLDLIARQLKEQGLGFYTISSSGHEGNAAFGKVFHLDDMAFLHYRSGAFYIQRAKQLANYDAIKDILLSLVASANDPISAGRHKVFGSVALNIPPQTSTIASHLPKALGVAFSIPRAKSLNLETKLVHDAISVCSFGDASVNHASAQATFNACSWLSHQSYPLPILFICEDNGLGISVPTPSDWIETSMAKHGHMTYLSCDGLNLADCIIKAQQAMMLVRQKKRPVFLHMRCVRLLGHAGSDIEQHYRTEASIALSESDDPLLHTARMLFEQQWMNQEQMITLYENNRALIKAKALEIMHSKPLSSAKAVMSSLIPKAKPKTHPPLPGPSMRESYFGSAFSQLSIKRNLCQHINFALTDLMIQHPNIVLFGEDVGKKGGVYRVTADLQARFGPRRVFDTLLDETTILGTAIGMAHNGFLPIPEIQFLAYLHNAEDQLRGEAATLSFFSNGQYQNPMVVRIPALAYQKGFGGHFHNDNSIAVLRDLPGVIVACPSNGPDAAKLLRSCVQLAQYEGRIVVFLEPIALYMTRDLHQEGDQGWLFSYPDLNEYIPFGEVSAYGHGETVILSYANGYYLARKAAKQLLEQHHLSIKIIDIHWLSPLPISAILREIKHAKHVLIVDEGRKSGSVSEGLMTLLIESGLPATSMKRLTGEDCFIPIGTAWQYLLPTTQTIIDAVLKLNA